MKLTIAGVHMDTGNSFQTHCEEKLSHLSKIFDHVVEADVQIKEEHGKTMAEVTIQANGIRLHAHGEGKDAFTALDNAEDKLAKQLQKYKGRLQKHKQRRQKTSELLQTLPQLSYTNHTVDESALETLPDELGADWMENMAPTIKQKVVSNLEPMSVDEAVMQMDLLHKPAFLFQNAQTGTVNVVYRNTDGSIQWVSPAN